MAGGRHVVSVGCQFVVRRFSCMHSSCGQSSDGFLVVFRRLPVGNQAVVSWFSGDRQMVSGSCQVVIRCLTDECP
jgi:hypothetical protein